MEHLSNSQSDLLIQAGRTAFGSARLRGVAALSVCAFLLMGVSGCIFSPREPDGPPGEGNQIPWETPSTTDAVLRNLAAAMAGEGTSNYMDCFTPDEAGGLEFHVDPQDSLAAGTEGDDRYAFWTRDDEATYIQGVFLDSDKGMTLTFSPVEDPDENADDTYRKDDYELTIVWRSGNHQPGESETFRGRVTLYLKKDATELWSIYKWVDRRLSDSGGASTWGVLRGDYRE
jgi:hypothetical protein